MASILRARGAVPFCFDSNRFPMEADLIAGQGLDGQGAIRTPEWTLPLDCLHAAWLRHTHVGLIGTEGVDADHLRAVRVQSDLALRAALSTLPCFTLDPPGRLDAAPFSLGQLRLARDCGMSVPRTLLSNDPRRVKEFIDGNPRGTICKMVQSSSSKVPGPNGWDFVPTRRISADDLPYLPRVALCPMVFQEEIPKARELRITAVGDHLFTAALDPQGAIDWRQDPALVGGFVPWNLDPAAAAALRRILAATGLRFATFDVLLTPEGEHVFLEYNCISFYDFIEDCAGLPISEAIVNLLISQDRPEIDRVRTVSVHSGDH